jgi:hypothetical protein
MNPSSYSLAGIICGLSFCEEFMGRKSIESRIEGWFCFTSPRRVWGD